MPGVALIAGQGRLPGEVHAALLTRGVPVRVCALEGFTPDTLIVDRVFRLERLGGFLAECKAAGVDRVCFAGAVKRPALDPAHVDAETRPLIERIAAALHHGDDGALRTILSIFEEWGFRVVGAHELAPDLLPGEGVMTSARPADGHGADAGRAEAIVAAMGKVDVGQACVVARGQALAVEALPGTDAMLAGLSPRPAGLPLGGLLYKAPKPGQDRRVDLPTIGPDTVRGAVAAGLDGVVIEAGGVILLDAVEAVAEADRSGLFLWIRRRATGL